MLISLPGILGLHNLHDLDKDTVTICLPYSHLSAPAVFPMRFLSGPVLWGAAFPQRLGAVHRCFSEICKAALLIWALMVEWDAEVEERHLALKTNYLKIQFDLLFEKVRIIDTMESKHYLHRF